MTEKERYEEELALREAERKGLCIGHGIDDDGREYEGYDLDGDIRFYHVDNGTEVEHD